MKDIRECTRCEKRLPLNRQNFPNNRIGTPRWTCTDCKGGRVCAESGCFRTRPKYGENPHSKLYCKEHGTARGFWSTKLWGCSESGCTIKPCFNFSSDQPGIYCAAHKKPGMFNVYATRRIAAAMPETKETIEDSPQQTRKCTYCKIIKPLTPVYFGRNRRCAGGYKWTCHNCPISRRCAADGCLKTRPFYGTGTTADELYCGNHRPPGGRNIYSTYCACGKVAAYGEPNDKRVQYCSKCKTETAINLRCKRCDCGVIPVFGFPTGKRVACNSCKQPGMVNLMNPLCPCNNRAIFAHPETGEKVACYRCATPDMVRVRNTRQCTCGKQPSFNYEDQFPPVCCIDCKLPGMVDVISPQCTTDGCKSRPRYGYPGNPPIKCPGHSEPDMIRNPRTVCTAESCHEIAIYGITEPRHCETHRESTEFNLIEQLCTSCQLLGIVDATGLCGYCSPENQLRTMLAKQRIVQAFLVQQSVTGNLPLFDTADIPVDHGECSKERPDFLWDCGGWYVILEVDEDQHRTYPKSCENIRMFNIHQSLGGPPVWFIRYNPDPLKVGNQRRDPAQITRHTLLIETLQRCLAVSPAETIQAVYLFYDQPINSEGFSVEETVENTIGITSENPTIITT